MSFLQPLFLLCLFLLVSLPALIPPTVLPLCQLPALRAFLVQHPSCLRLAQEESQGFDPTPSQLSSCLSDLTLGSNTTTNLLLDCHPLVTRHLLSSSAARDGDQYHPGHLVLRHILHDLRTQMTTYPFPRQRAPSRPLNFLAAITLGATCALVLLASHLAIQQLLQGY
eukprot:Protomagalhaensia_sp_Gyna_25__1336@NODE_1671_length_1636_cov_4_374452_g1368_i0_p2_GENE_NODE_1671_length_1636_cov_4_374452_g1368_i0NODE_1671_length_1636_cov_4_374452_g1368_i0_p2_ORF_typecomplete_len168_score7_26DUF4010/PF13194_6/4_2e02DUF4010/PF13194_6/0_18_NODE_1671_length_1636_cov_4_374452_g1368_i028531